MALVVARFMSVMACGIAVISTLDIRAGRGFETSGGLAAARDPVSGDRLLPPWLAEYGTAAALIVGALGLVVDGDMGHTVAAAAPGALAYTSLNSLAWVLGSPDRRAYGIPMTVVLVGALVSLLLLVAEHP